MDVLDVTPRKGGEPLLSGPPVVFNSPACLHSASNYLSKLSFKSFYQFLASVVSASDNLILAVILCTCVSVQIWRDSLSSDLSSLMNLGKRFCFMIVQILSFFLCVCEDCLMTYKLYTCWGLKKFFKIPS